MHGGSSEGLEICIKTHSEALIILQTSILKVLDIFNKITKFLYTFFFLFGYDKILIHILLFLLLRHT